MWNSLDLGDVSGAGIESSCVRTAGGLGSESYPAGQGRSNVVLTGDMISESSCCVSEGLEGIEKVATAGDFKAPNESVGGSVRPPASRCDEDTSIELSALLNGNWREKLGTKEGSFSVGSVGG